MDATGPAPRSVCSQCPPETGGESSDFGGSPDPCTLFEQRAAIDSTQAAELGFDITRLARLVERDIDAPLRWTPMESWGGPAAGYEPETWIEGKPKILGYTHVGLDPRHCSGTTCVTEAGDELTCSDRLELDIEVELRTLDGAVSALASGYVLQGREGFPFGDSPAGSQRANLRDVSGTLEVFPDENLVILQALLMIDLYFKADRIEGDLRPSILLSQRPGSVAEYIPLSGHWPDAR
jgi:hypothetical protein